MIPKVWSAIVTVTVFLFAIFLLIYNTAYDAAVSRYEATKAEREKVAADIQQRGIRRREFERFIAELEKLPETVSDYDVLVRNGLSKLFLILLEIQEHTADEKLQNTYSLRQENRLQHFLEYIHAHYGEHITLDDLASTAAISKTEVMRCFKSVIGKSPMRYLMEYRLQQAANLLLHTERTVQKRMPAEKFFFDGSFDKPLSGTEHKEIADLIEMVRWAPSAVNKQPWRIVRETDSLYHFYEKKDKGYVSDSTGDLQKIDVGIALCHFVMGLEEQGKKTAVEVNDPGISIPGDVEYIASVQIW